MIPPNRLIGHSVAQHFGTQSVECHITGCIQQSITLDGKHLAEQMIKILFPRVFSMHKGQMDKVNTSKALASPFLKAELLSMAPSSL